jgi:hypothetical protein
MDSFAMLHLATILNSLVSQQRRRRLDGVCQNRQNRAPLRLRAGSSSHCEPQRLRACNCTNGVGFCKDRRDRCSDRCRDRPNRVGFCRDCRDRKLRCLKLTLLITVPTVPTKTHTVWTVPRTVPTTVPTVPTKTHTVLAFASGGRSNVF